MSAYLCSLALCLCAAPFTSFCNAPVILLGQQNQTKGTDQASGSAGLFGTTYTVIGADGFGPINFTLMSAAYSVEPVCFVPGHNYTPGADQKLLVVHYRIKNPNKGDFYVGSRTLFQAVDASGNLVTDCGDSKSTTAKTLLDVMLKPGQGVDDIYTCLTVPANGPVTKLILMLGRAGSNEKVIRYAISGKTNVIKPLAAPYADPADKLGATALATIQASAGTAYTTGFLDLNVGSLSLSPGPIGSLTAEDGKQFLVAAVTLTNRSSGQQYYDGNLHFTLKTDEDKITDYQTLKPKSDVGYEGMQLDAGESTTERFVFQVPKGAQLKTLSVSSDNAGPMSRTFVYSLSTVK